VTAHNNSAAPSPANATVGIEADTYPRQYARTRRMSLGEPRSFRSSANGERVSFLRSNGGSDPFTRLWLLEQQSIRTSDDAVSPTWIERLIVDPADLDRSADGELPPEELARRERLREQADGITSYDVDRELTRAVFALNGAVYVADLSSGVVHSLATRPGAYDPRISPNGRFVGYISDRCLHVIAAELNDMYADDRLVAGEEDEKIQWGVADFNAAEEFDRYRGFWWSPDSKSLLAARVDDTPVQSWWISDPANPNKTPRQHLYPAAGTENTIVSLAIFDVASLHRIDVDWSGPTTLRTHTDWPYLVDASWGTAGCTIVLMNRAQSEQSVLEVNTETGTLRELHTTKDSVWVERTSGTPHRLPDGSLLITVDEHIGPRMPAGLPDALETGNWLDPEGTRALARKHPNGTVQLLTPSNLQVRQLAHVSTTYAYISASASRPIEGGDNLPAADPGAISILRVALDGSTIDVIAGGSDVGVHDIDTAFDDTMLVVRSASVNRTRAEHRIINTNSEGKLATSFAITSHAEVALVNPRPKFFRAGPRALPYTILLPSTHTDSLDKLPVLLDPYGGPHAQRVVQSRNAHASSQWFADQGFAVVVIDGRGTPGLGPNFERAVRNDLASGVLEDQVTGLHDAADRFPQLDLTRVGIRGWSFGGYLAALAVLDRPDVFHCAIAGAPVTEWRLYDTGYTERYLGDPRTAGAIYDANSLLTRAHKLSRPLMLIHGLADDNVVAAHTLRLSSALLAAGKPHEVLPLSGVTHMTPQEIVAENLLKLQVDFLNRHLRLDL
jgi:dipeptidyl-peptidase 4